MVNQAEKKFQEEEEFRKQHQELLNKLEFRSYRHEDYLKAKGEVITLFEQIQDEETKERIVNLTPGSSTGNTLLHLAVKKEDVGFAVFLMADCGAWASSLNRASVTAREIPTSQSFRNDMDSEINKRFSKKILERFSIQEETISQDISKPSVNNKNLEKLLEEYNQLMISLQSDNLNKEDYLKAKNEILEIFKQIPSDIIRKEIIKLPFNWNKDNILHLAARKGDVDFIESLSKKGYGDYRALKYTSNEQLKTPMGLIVERLKGEYLPLAKDLQSDNLNEEDYLKAKNKVIEFLKGISISIIRNEIVYLYLNENRDTLTHIAANKGDVDLLSFLTETCHADPNIKNKEGITPREILLNNETASHEFFNK